MRRLVSLVVTSRVWRVFPEAPDSLLVQRRERVREVKHSYCILEDEATLVTVFAHRSAFEAPTAFSAVEPGDVLRLAYEPGDRGPRAVADSARIVHSPPSRTRPDSAGL